MKERKGFRGFIDRVFGKGSKRDEVKRRKADLKKMPLLGNKVKGGFSTRKKNERGNFGKPGTKMGRKLFKEMSGYMQKTREKAFRRYGRNIKAVNEYLRNDQYYCVCADAIRLKRKAG